MASKEFGPIHRHLNTHAAEHPDAIAIQSADDEITYGELSDLTDRLASVLVSRGVEKGSRVALFFDQSCEAVVALLGVLKAGGIFIPLDTNDPGERIVQILDDSDPELILAGASYNSAVRSFANTRETQYLIYDRQSAGTSESLPEVSENDIAYIFYTSGSTGKPKGVCQTHRNLEFFVSAYSDRLEITQSDNLSLLYSLNFSASNLDVFSALLAGAKVSLYNTRTRGVPDLVQWIQENNITVLHCIPSVLRQLLKFAPSDLRFDSVRAIDLGGEPVYATDVDALRAHFQTDCSIFNHLAATEASVIAQYEINLSQKYTTSLLPVGTPPEGVEISIVESEAADNSNAESGEIIVTSDYLSPGYYNNESLSAGSFFVHDSKRSYRSKDFGYLDSEGNLYFAGRESSRAKVNGHTVDLREVESAFLSIPEVENAVVQVSGHSENEPFLFAHLAMKTSRPVDEQYLRTKLVHKIPRYMLPRHIIQAKTLPLTATGKIDRKSLKAPAQSTIENPMAGTANISDSVKALFEDALKKNDPDAGTSWFDLGGDSLGILNIVLQIEMMFGVKLPMSLISSDASIQNISRFVEENSRKKIAGLSNNQSIIEPIGEIKPGRPNLFLVHGLNGNVYVGKKFVEIVNRHFNAYGFKARGLNPGEAPSLSIQGMAADYISVIRNIQAGGPYFVSGLCAGGVIAVEMAKQLTMALEPVAPVVVFDPPTRSKKPVPARQFKAKLGKLYREFHSPSERNLETSLINMSNRVAEGRISMNTENIEEVRNAYRIQTAIHIALANYVSLTYKGEVLILGSRERLDRKKAEGDSYISGRLKHFCVSEGHDNALNLSNELFYSTASKCFDYCFQSGLELQKGVQKAVV